MICPECGKEIRYIATGRDETAVCGTQPVEIVTANGLILKGYLKHSCENKKYETSQREIACSEKDA